MIKLLHFLLIILLIIFFQNSFAQKKKNTISERKHDKEALHRKSVIKYGTASFYATKFQGRKTANGEIYRPEKYTAACNVFPLQSWIKVTNLSNNKSVIVKINDRMNSKNKRLVDLSKIAAKKLGFITRGIVKVKVELLNNYSKEKRK